MERGLTGISVQCILGSDSTRFGEKAELRTVPASDARLHDYELL